MFKSRVLSLFLLFGAASPLIGEEPITKAEYVEEVTVDPEVDEYQSFEGVPLKVTITVTHDKRLKVDEASFRFGEKKLEVELLKEVQISPDSTLILSIYQTTIPPQKAGLHTLPSVSVDVGGTEYQSLPLYISVQKKIPF